MNLSILYLILIKPIEYLIDIVFSIFYRAFNNSIISAIMVSVFINLITYPLFDMAEKLQNDERNIQNIMKDGIKHIKNTFKGDEQFFMLNTYYRENNYKPIYALRSSLSIIFQIPFFMAAYNFFINNEVSINESFYLIKDISKPDMLIKTNFGVINLLPILMTFITIVSSIYYTKGHSIKEKLQLYGMSIVFLFLLYNSPALLVIYWITNNVLSFFKIIYIKNKKIILPLIKYVILILGIVAHFWFRKHGVWDGGIKVLFYNLILYISFVPLIFSIVLKITKTFFSKKNSDNIEKSFLKRFELEDKYFYIALVLFLVVSGFTTIISIIQINPAEFVGLNDCRTIIFYNFLIYLGYSLWLLIYFVLLKNKYITNFFVYLVILLFVNHIYFNNGLGMISIQFIYDTDINFSREYLLLNIFVSIALFFIIEFLILYKRNIVMTLLFAVLLFNVGLNIYMYFNTISMLKITSSVEKEKKWQDYDGIWEFSKNGKNVFLIVIDKAMGGYVPYIFNEKEELKQQFDGFTYYPNTASYGMYTTISTPTIYGGYEYTPDNMNRNVDKLLVDKHDEGMQVVPAIFNDEGYNVVLNDVPNMRYVWNGPMDQFDKYKNIKTYRLCGNFTDNIINDETKEKYKMIQLRSAVFYSAFRMAPNILKKIIYNSGTYHYITKNTILSTVFIENYSLIKQIPKFLKIKDDDSNNMISFYSALPHDHQLLNPETYLPLTSIKDVDIFGNKSRFVFDGKELKMESEYQIATYDVNMCSFLEIGKFLDILKENGVYDNTRIMVISDHGKPVGQYQDFTYGNEENLWLAESYNPVFMFKDFNSHGISINNDFMTLADTPYLLTKDIIENPKNPFTNKKITSNKEDKEEVIVNCINAGIDVDFVNSSYTADRWFSVHDNIYNLDNWKELDYNPKQYEKDGK